MYYFIWFSSSGKKKKKKIKVRRPTFLLSLSLQKFLPRVSLLRGILCQGPFFVSKFVLWVTSLKAVHFKIKKEENLNDYFFLMKFETSWKLSMWTLFWTLGFLPLFLRLCQICKLPLQNASGRLTLQTLLNS